MWCSLCKSTTLHVHCVLPNYAANATPCCCKSTTVCCRNDAENAALCCCKSTTVCCPKGTRVHRCEAAQCCCESSAVLLQEHHSVLLRQHRGALQRGHHRNEPAHVQAVRAQGRCRAGDATHGSHHHPKRGVSSAVLLQSATVAAREPQ